MPGPTGAAFDGRYLWVASSGNGNSPGTVAKLKTDGTIVGSYPVGLQPWGVAFDGANIWVANMGAGTVSKLRASDGENLGTINVNSGGVLYVAFAGENMWVSARNGLVYELRDKDGAQLGSFSPGDEGLAFDGANIWAAGFAGSEVTKF